MFETYRQDMELRMKDCDFAGRWRPGSIFEAMQEAGESDTKRVGTGYYDLLKMDLAWVITRARLNMIRYPRHSERVIITTWPGNTRLSLFPRFYLFDTSEGERLGSAATIYVLMDLKERKMAPSERTGFVDVRRSGIPDEKIALPGGVKPLPAERAKSMRRRLSYTDIDHNGHVNNARYIDWLTDAQDINRFRDEAFSEILIHFDRELTFEKYPEAETVTCEEDGQAYMDIRAEDGIHVSMRAKWDRL